MARILEQRGLTLYEVAILPGTAPTELHPVTRQPYAYKLGGEITPGVRTRLPITNANMETVIEYEMAEAVANIGLLPILHQFAPIKDRVEIVKRLRVQPVDRELYPHALVDANGLRIVGAAIGFDNSSQDTSKLVKAGAGVIVFDSANGYTPGFHEHLEKIKTIFEGRIKRARDVDGGSKVGIVAGNVGTQEGVVLLFEYGADTAKVGIGSGTGCDTGPQTGIYVPQLTALQLARQAADKFPGRLIMSDGGIKTPKDAMVALSLADTAMLGSVFAGTEESPGLKVITDGKTMKGYAGSASPERRRKRGERYPNQFQGQKEHEAPEGLSGFVIYRGPVDELVTQWENVMRTTLWYVGVSDFNQYREHAVLLPLSDSAREELRKGDIFRG